MLQQAADRPAAESPASIKMVLLYVTQHEKIGLMCTKYTPSHYFNYLTSCIRYTSSVNAIELPIHCCTSSTIFVDKLCLGTKLRNFKVQKVVKFYAHISPIFSCRVTYYNGCSKRERILCFTRKICCQKQEWLRIWYFSDTVKMIKKGLQLKPSEVDGRTALNTLSSLCIVL